MKTFFALAGVLAMVFCVAGPAWAGDGATPREVIAKVQEAADVVKEQGEAAFAEFNDPEGRWVWGGTYVWVQECGEDSLSPTLVTHPVKPALIGKDLSRLKDKNGVYFFLEFCEVCKNPNGGWVEYQWPKPGEKQASRKISYIIDVPGTPYEVGAGIYDEDVSLEELNRMIQ